MLTSNLGNADRLLNGQLGTAFDFQFSEGSITKICVKFNFAKMNGVVPSERR